MKVTCSYSPELLKQVNKIIKKHQQKIVHPEIRKFNRIAIFFFLLWLICFVVLIVQLPILTILGGVIFILFIGSIIVCNQKEAILNFLETVQHEPVTFELTPEGLYQTSTKIQSFRSWESIRQVVFEEGFILFFISSKTALHIPRDAFASENERHDFYHTATSYWHEAKKARFHKEEANQEVAATNQELMKECPECAELVKARAKICRFCGHSFDRDSN
jgi:predicted RNA-binding Zn-ribbon protein involved in translation (DUF1610 family)